MAKLWNYSPRTRGDPDFTTLIFYDIAFSPRMRG